MRDGWFAEATDKRLSGSLPLGVDDPGVGAATSVATPSTPELTHLPWANHLLVRLVILGLGVPHAVLAREKETASRPRRRCKDDTR